MNWLNNFDERQRKEIEFSILYLNQFEHGTDGHNAKVIIAKMASILNALEHISLSEDHPGKMLEMQVALGINPISTGDLEVK